MHEYRTANYSKTICRCTHGDRARDHTCGYTGFAATAAVVSVYVSVGEKWEMGHATRALVGRERVSESGVRTVSLRSSRFPLHGAPSLRSASNVLRVLSFSTLFSQPLIRESYVSPSPSITRDTSVSHAFHTHP